MQQDIVGIREAARELGKSPSTISRQVRNGLIPNRGTDTEPKVSIAEARSARSAGLVQKQPTLGTFRTDHERVKAEKADLELQRLKGLLVSRADVEEFLAEQGSKLRDALLRRWRELARELAGLTPREIEEKGLAADELALSVFAAQLEQ